MKKYDIIYADPAWQYGSKELYGDKNKEGKRENRFRTLERIYQTMGIEEIKQLPINEITNVNSACFLWCTDSHIKQGIEVLESWVSQRDTLCSLHT